MKKKDITPAHFECRAGWHALIQKALDKLDHRANVFQIKEKFGGLRINLVQYTERRRKITDAAEEEASRTCEECGAQTPDVSLRAGSWLRTLCDLHAEGRKSLWGPRVGCKKCGDVIRSKHRHDFVSCKCGAISVDGGSAYTRAIGNRENFDWTVT